MKAKIIKRHFKEVDPVIHGIIKEMDIEILKITEKPSGYFAKLCREIITQQLASKAAEAIRERFYNLFADKKPTPQKVISISKQKLRDVGMSWAKVKYIKDLAHKTKKGQVQFDSLHLLDNDAVIAELVKVKGIGPWTAEMFLIFTLGREDVFSYGDLGLRRAIRNLYKIKEKADKSQIERIVKKWSPYKSYASLALWKTVD